MEQAPAQPDPQEKPARDARARVRDGARVALAALREAAPVAISGYLLLAVFALAYWLLAAGWPGLPSRSRIAIALLVVAPVALGLLWPRLTGFKAFGFEVSLSQVAVHVDTALAPAISSAPPTSGVTDITLQIQRAIAQPDTELVEVDLRDGNYWWTTRLFLLAALADDFSSIQGLVFVEGGVKRTFVGGASPAAVRKALAGSTPELEATYREIAERPPMLPGGDRVGGIVSRWTTRQFGSPPVAEKEFTGVTSPDSLHEVLAATGRPLIKASVEWSGIPDSRLVRSIISNFDSRYVALLRAGSLDRVVNRLELAVRIAVDSMKR